MPQNLSEHDAHDRVTEQLGAIFEGQKAQPHNTDQEGCLRAA